jgi:hypothetical protein
MPPSPNIIAASMFSNHLKLFSSEGKAVPEKVAIFLDISLNKLAKAIGVDTLRAERLGPIAEQRLQELASALELVAQSLDGNISKARFWINTPNLHLGGSVPKTLILLGKYRKVVDFVNAVRDE